MLNQNRIQTSDASSAFRTMTPGMARRQLHISIAVLAVSAGAIFFFATQGNVHPRHTAPGAVTLTVQMPGSMKLQEAVSNARVQPGG